MGRLVISERTEESAALHVWARLDACQRKYRRCQIDETDELIVHTGRLAGHTDNHRHVQAGVVDPPFHTRQAVAVVTPEEDDGVIGQPVFFELLKDLADLRIHPGDVVILPGNVAPDDGRVGVVGRHRHGGGVGDQRRRGVRREVCRKSQRAIG